MVVQHVVEYGLNQHIEKIASEAFNTFVDLMHNKVSPNSRWFAGNVLRACLAGQ